MSYWSDRFSVWTQTPRRAVRVVIGEKVRILRGPLEGITGTVCGTKTHDRYLLKVDHLPGGVYVRVASDAIELIEAGRDS